MLSTEDKEMMKGLYENYIIKNGHELSEDEIKRTLDQIRKLEKAEEESIGTIMIDNSIFDCTGLEINSFERDVHPRYIYMSPKGNFYISKKINQKDVNFGTYDFEEDAKVIVEKLKDYGWNKDKLPRIWYETGISPTPKSMSRMKRKRGRGLNPWLM